LGLGYRKARGVPAKADPEAQAEFLDSTLRPLLNQAEAGTRRVFFADAAHFVRGGFLAYLWCLVRWVVPTGSGRQRYSVLGALDAATRTLVRETTDGTVTEVTAGRLLAVNWLPPWRGWEDALLYLFDLGTHETGELDPSRFLRREIAGAHWLTVVDAAAHVAPYTARMLELAGDAEHPLYLENSEPPAGT